MLVQEPSLLTARGGAGLASHRRTARTSGVTSPPGAETVFSHDDPDGTAVQTGPEAPDHTAIGAAARAVAAALVVARPQPEQLAHRGGGQVVSRRFRGDGDEIDLDRTLEALADRRPLLAEDVLVREPRRMRRSLVLAVDVSGSMRGERMQVAGAAVGALATARVAAELAIIAFWSDAALLIGFGERLSVEAVMDALLAIRPRGLTNVTCPLEFAAAQLRHAAAGSRHEVLLLSDCVHNAGPDPRHAAARLPRLNVLLDARAEHDAALARELADAGRGRMAPVRRPADLPGALSLLLDPRPPLPR